MTPARGAEIWEHLKSGSNTLHPSPRSIAAWHRAEADDCDAMQRRREWPEDRAAALFHRSKVIQFEQGQPQDMLLRAIAHAQMNDWSRAKADYQTALTLGVSSDGLTSHEILLQIMTGNTEAYRKSCQQLMTQIGSTDDSEQANDAVWLCCLLPDALQNYDLALRMMRAAADRLPTRNNILNTLGAALFRAGQWEEAIRTLQPATEFFPDKKGSAFDQVFLAMACQASGRSAEARTFLKQATGAMDKLGPDAKWKWEVELKLLRKEAEQRIGLTFD